MRGIGLIVLAALAIVPEAASAQFRSQGVVPGGRPDYRPAQSDSPREDTAHVRDAIDRGRDSGQLSRREARRLRREANQIDMLADRYGSDGMSDAEARELATRERVLGAQVSAQRTAGFPGKPSH